MIGVGGEAGGVEVNISWFEKTKIFKKKKKKMRTPPRRSYSWRHISACLLALVAVQFLLFVFAEKWGVLGPVMSRFRNWSHTPRGSESLATNLEKFADSFHATAKGSTTAKTRKMPWIDPPIILDPFDPFDASFSDPLRLDTDRVRLSARECCRE
jgi:hypothetical protein